MSLLTLQKYIIPISLTFILFSCNGQSSQNNEEIKNSIFINSSDPKSRGRFLIFLLLAILTFGLTSCSKEDNYCKIKIATCNEIPPKGEVCQAFFRRWFYDKATNKCNEIGYSGCSQKGFATEKECEECKCR